MNYSDERRKGEYASLIERTDKGDNMNINTHDFDDNLNRNNLKCGKNINNQSSENENVPLGTPLTYIVGNEGEYVGGQPMNYEHIEGNKRLHTDVKYSVYFFTYIFVLFICILYYFYHGDYARVLYGTNYNGKICGRHMKNYSYLYFPLSPKLPKMEILSKYGKCLESCPTLEERKKEEKQKEEIAETNLSGGAKSKESFFENPFSFFDKTKKETIVDKKGNRTTNVVYGDYTKSLHNNLYVEYSLNSPYYDTVNIMNICYPRDKVLRQKVINIVFTDRYKTLVNLFSFHNAVFYVFLFVFLTIILCFIYLFSLYYIPAATFHLSLTLFICSMFFYPIYFIHKHLYLLFNPIKGTFFSYHYLTSIFVCFVLLAHGIIYLFILYLYKNTYKYTHRLITVTLNFINNVSNVLYSPFIVSVFSFLWFFIWMYGYIYIMTAGALHEKRLQLELDKNGNSEIVSLQKVFHYFRSSYIFSIFWIYSYFFVCEILQSLNQFTISYLGAVWYFCDKNSVNYNLSAQATMKTILNYHLGSLILSSFINLCTKHLRVLFFWTNSTLSLPFFSNETIHNLKERFSLFLRPISNLIDKHTVVAYCEISMTSYPYLFSCYASSKKLINSTSPAASLHGITYIVNIIFPCLTTLIVTFVSFNIFNNFERYRDLVSPSFVPNPFFASFIIGVLCGEITSYFITIISTITDSILYCFICECYQKQMIDENPLRKIYTPPLLKELILEIYQDYNTPL
ncbi:hypothetical protein, conserved [Plasmodium gonderi]|uniref:Choline transporter-like protein n=1 Tax=Plasmodium gonderi TaxID=77519 RepID=A0A1Y1JNW4_PLAGO|nr:hypothetical protein, conserved [Plasmodium gonderi]GAW82917.1 hypothetical protein, conserved [Plasmodium gonderi]